MSSRAIIESLPKSKTQPQKMLISAADYQRMGVAGIFAGKPRVELIEGEIYTTTPISSEHNSHVAKINSFFTVNLLGKAIILPQGSVHLDDFSEPEPDIAILRFRKDFYHRKHAKPADILLLIEVAVHSLEFDRTTKLQKYAAAGISEYWIVIPEKGLIEVYRDPEGEVYRAKTTYGKEDTWELEVLALPMRGKDLLVEPSTVPN